MHAVNNGNVSSGNVVDHNIGNLNRMETVVDQENVTTSILRKHGSTRTGRKHRTDYVRITTTGVAVSSV